ncbi:MAG: PIN domain-containing protein [Promethearchaeota archaeon]|nr:MAG: PIN domain-containing protein [Candidatus Lokiarchaeota archaeon]
MKLIIDTNVLISSLLKDSTTRELLLNESFEFYLPEIVMSEVKKYLHYIIQKSGKTEEEIKKLLNILLENLNLVPIKEYEKDMDEALKIMGKIDEKETEFIALSLSITNDGIWSNDKHFNEQTKIIIYKTVDVINLLEKKSQSQDIEKKINKKL